MDAGRLKRASAAYEQELLRTPNRTPPIKGLARANAGEIAVARRLSRGRGTRSDDRGHPREGNGPTALREGLPGCP